MKNVSEFVTKLFSAALLLILASCLYPEAPGAGTVRSTQPLDREQKIDWVEMAPYTVSFPTSAGRSTSYRTVKRSKNLLLIITDADGRVSEQLKPELDRIYKRPLRLEDVLWWHYAPAIQKTYNYTMRVHWDGFNAGTLKASLDSMESLKTNYDVFLLTHALPNYVMASPGQGMIPFSDIDAMKGRLHYADGLYFQACYGDTLYKDFLDTGFRSVVAFHGLNENFFFPDYFFRSLADFHGDFRRAFTDTAEHFAFKFRMNPVNQKIVKTVFKKELAGGVVTEENFTALPVLYQP